MKDLDPAAPVDPHAGAPTLEVPTCPARGMALPPGAEGVAAHPVFAPCVAAGCLQAGRLDAALRSLDDPAEAAAARALLAHYQAETLGEATPSLCSRLRSDAALATARGDEPAARRITAALTLHLRAHHPG